MLLTHVTHWQKYMKRCIKSQDISTTSHWHWVVVCRRRRCRHLTLARRETRKKNANQSANSWPITGETTGSISGVKHFPARGLRKIGSDKQKRLYRDFKKNIKNWSNQRDCCAVSRAIRRPPCGFPASKRRSWRTCHFHWAEKKKLWSGIRHSDHQLDGLIKSLARFGKKNKKKRKNKGQGAGKKNKKTATTWYFLGGTGRKDAATCGGRLEGLHVRSVFGWKVIRARLSRSQALTHLAALSIAMELVAMAAE